MTATLRGVIAAAVTTFSDTGELDVESFAVNIGAHLATGLHGVVVAGSTGEAALLDASERAALVTAARHAVPSDKLLIVGTGAESTRTCLQLTREAASRGADAVLVVAPHYYTSAMTGPALIRHYWRVADESPIPVVLYNIPKYMHFSLSPTLVAELATHDNVIGIKDSSGNRELFASYLNAQSPTFSVMTGNAPMFHHALTLGASGGILAAAVFAAALTLEVYDAVQRGDDAAATAAQVHLAPLGAKVVGELGIAGVKAAMDRVGLVGGPVRAPLLPLTDEQSRMLAELLRAELPATV